MADPDLRPFSLGEILDRTFSLYRRRSAYERRATSRYA
jgi:hypothetical protein